MSSLLKMLGIIFVICLHKPWLEAKPRNSTEPVELGYDIESSEESDTDLSFESRTAEDDGILNEQGSYFQGDIELEPDQEEILTSVDIFDKEAPVSRVGILSQDYRWPKNNMGKVIVPYRISPEYNDLQRRVIRLGMLQIESNTCVRFYVKTFQPDYVVIGPRKRGCSSKLGRIGGAQNLTLSRGCFKVGTVIHELIHALGYTHMQNHVDREKYVKIQWENIHPDHINKFDEVNVQKYGSFDTSYDYHSVMHYGLRAFSKGRGELTIIPRHPKYKSSIGQRSKLSKGDIKRIKNMYQCSNK